ncbi:bifunctional diaminohydroxyphosphoribosylaminopyrimidine deaminase/5-amino-6-(5-phosphoribosylamino)uracil reductase RibD [Parasediminibacterium sp. JCM 36343]|uniref:bifunctional diaminohydroxyphosphoribosylaminopyrimidine deaminase/5-amino-6-(5-phosphoribosylamino)uracil reductase RibD n=1 Tax=Parasediminibacterium sp. JCM 36343 TaxID=3374279 RepID=UPI00397D15FF
MNLHQPYMRRCLQLAQLGRWAVAPNPMVGSVLVHEGRIIGEGYHQQYGQAHAEVNCINSVAENDKHLIPLSTIYVSLEPCAHFGKTPPCADLIIKHQIPKVVVGCRDSFEAVDGKGIERLKAAGIDVLVGVLEAECKELNKRFFTFHARKRPFIVLKWAETANHFIGSHSTKRLLISNDITNRLVHKWRSEEAAILVGTNTTLQDNPSLSNRLWSGKQPIRLVIDMELALPTSLQLFDQQQPTIVFNYLKQEEKENLIYYQLKRETAILPQIMNMCYKKNIQSILVEGGSKTLQSFIDYHLWDEARVITNTQLSVADGVHAPILFNAAIEKSFMVDNDRIQVVNYQL